MFLPFLHSIGLSQANLKSLFLDQENPDYEWVFSRLDTEMLETIGIRKDEKICDILRSRDTLDRDRISRLIAEKQIQIIDWNHRDYPERLRQIGHAPYFFYLRGVMKSKIPLIGVVGSRKCSRYGRQWVEKIIPELLTHGYGIVSGGAHGIDSIAHETTLDHGGYTISVLGTGIDRSYPAQNAPLFRRIIESGGAVISHFPLGMGPEMYNFPIRNEIVAALSLGVFLPEAAEGSGTIITAQLALEHSRDVFALPWDIDRETAGGTNRLISTGQAKCITSALGIIEEYEGISTGEWHWDLSENPTVNGGKGISPMSKQETKSILPVFESELQSQIWDSIQSWHTTLDEISDHLSTPLSQISSDLTMMELFGWIGVDGVVGQYYVKAR